MWAAGLRELKVAKIRDMPSSLERRAGVSSARENDVSTLQL